MHTGFSLAPDSWGTRPEDLSPPQASVSTSCQQKERSLSHLMDHSYPTAGHTVDERRDGYILMPGAGNFAQLIEGA